MSGLLLMFKGKFEFLDIVLDKIDFCQFFAWNFNHFFEVEDFRFYSRANFFHLKFLLKNILCGIDSLIEILRSQFFSQIHGLEY